MTCWPLITFLLLYFFAHLAGGQQPECLISPSNRCNVRSHPIDQTVLIYPPTARGGAVCLAGSPYRFQLIRGSGQHLLIHFQGGGACWDSVSVVAGLCTTKANPVEARGIMDRASKLNPYRNYTVLVVLYCSGDVHLGNRDWSYFFNTVRVNQRGQKNVMAVYSYLQGMIAAKQLGDAKGKFKAVVLSGSSAGALGVQIWSGYFLSRLKYDRAAVIADSLAGLFPHEALKPLLKLYNVCSYVGSLTAKSSSLGPLCQQSQLTIQNVLLSTMQAFPSTPFCFIQSKEDAVQIDFFDGVDLTRGFSSTVLEGPSFYQASQSFLQVFNAAAPNWLIYWVNGNTHEFLTKTWLFVTNTAGAASSKTLLSSNASVPTTSTPMLYSWISRLPLKTGSTISSQCSDASGQLCGADFAGKTFGNV